MNIIDLFVSELEREVKRTRRALELVPDHKRSWKPQGKSMEFGRLADMVSTIPLWLTMIVKQDELDVTPKGAAGTAHAQSETSAEFIAALEKAAAGAKDGLDQHQRGASANELEVDGRRSRCLRHTAPCAVAGHDQPLVASPRPDDRVSAPYRREGSGPLRPFCRR
jgi:hypothetical protein